LEEEEEEGEDVSQVQLGDLRGEGLAAHGQNVDSL